MFPSVLHIRKVTAERLIPFPTGAVLCRVLGLEPNLTANPGFAIAQVSFSESLARRPASLGGCEDSGRCVGPVLPPLEFWQAPMVGELFPLLFLHQNEHPAWQEYTTVWVECVYLCGSYALGIGVVTVWKGHRRCALGKSRGRRQGYFPQESWRRQP